MISLEKAYANYINRKFVVVSNVSLDDYVREFYDLKSDSVFILDNFFDVGELNKNCEKAKAICYKPKFGFLGQIEVIKNFCKEYNIFFIEDFTESFSANKIISEKCLYAGIFGDISVCVKDNVFFYATEDENLAVFLHSVATLPSHSQKQKLIDSLFEVEVVKRRRRIATANYTTLIAYLGLFHFLRPLKEREGEAASFPAFVVTAKDEKFLWQFLIQAGFQVSLWKSFLLLPTDITETDLKNIMELISKFYKEVCV